MGGKAPISGNSVARASPVPPAFAIPAQAYLEAVDAAEIERSSSNATPLRGRRMTRSSPGNRGNYRISFGAWPCPTTCAHRSAGPTPISARRSVAVRVLAPAEDAADTSFAGIHESYTDVVGDEALIDAVRACWASLWTPRALTYRSLRGYTDEPSLAVVVQRMVRSDRSGVASRPTPAPATGTG